MARRFVSEAIQPVVATSDTARMAAGEPGLPQEFRWRGETLRIAHVLRAWKETGPCTSGSGEAYVRKHWYEVVTDTDRRLQIYFERQARARGRRTDRWWLYSISEPD